MKTKKILLVLFLLFIPSLVFADEYVLVMSKDDNVCQHMLKLCNDDLKKYGEIKYSQHKEFNTIKWEERNYSYSFPGDKTKTDIPILISRFDINNDGKPEIIVKDYRRGLKGRDSDRFYVFREGDLNYFQNGVTINDDFANKAIGVWGDFGRKPFEGNGYKLYEIPGPEVWEFKGRKIPVKYFLGGWFYFHPFLYGNKYFVSMNDWHPDMVEKWEVILYFTPENKLKDTCYFIKVCGCNNEKKGGK